MKPKFFNVTLLSSPAYPHSFALKEAADYVHASLVECGYPAARTTSQIARNAVNVVFCAHCLTPEQTGALPADTILFNSEQLEDAAGWHFRSGYRALLERHVVWDYSPQNLRHIPHPRKAVIPFGFHRSLRRTDLARERGTVLLFYGALTPRRERLVAEIRAAGVPVDHLFGVYGDDRDRALLRSWAVLNLHKHDGVATSFEPIRCFYPLINGVPVISEDSADPVATAYRAWMYFFDASTLIQDVGSLYRERADLTAGSEDMFSRFRSDSALPPIRAAVESYFQWHS